MEEGPINMMTLTRLTTPTFLSPSSTAHLVSQHLKIHVLFIDYYDPKKR